MLIRISNVSFKSMRAMNGIRAYEKNSRQRMTAGKTGAIQAPDPARQAQIDRTARVLRILVLNARAENQPDPRNVRGNLCDTYG